MEKEFIPYEQAVALKDLGFDEPCIMCYYGISNADTDKKERLYLSSGIGKVCNSHLVEKENGITAPLYQQAFRWFREKYNFEHSILRYTYSGGVYQGRKYMFIVEQYDEKYNHELPENENHWIINEFQSKESEFSSYEKAELACLQKLIEIVKSK